MIELFRELLATSQTSRENQILIALDVSIVILLFMSISFALLVIFLRIKNSFHEKTWAHLHKLWNVAVLEVLSGDLSADEFRRLIPQKHQLNFVRFLASYAYRLRGSDLKILSELAKPYLPHVIDQFKHRNSGVRAWAVNTINLLGMPQYENVIEKALDDKSPKVAMFAASALLKTQKLVYVEQILKSFHRFQHWNLNSLISLLSKIGSDAIPISRIVYLDRNENLRTRIVAAEVLKKLKDYAIADDVVEILDKETDRELLAASLRLISQVGQQKHRPIVLKLGKSPDDVIRINAVKALRQLCIDEDKTVFQQAIDDPSPWVAIQAAWGLKELGDLSFLNEMVANKHRRARLALQVMSINPELQGNT
jgi:HEAT repeat protein